MKKLIQDKLKKSMFIAAPFVAVACGGGGGSNMGASPDEDEPPPSSVHMPPPPLSTQATQPGVEAVATEYAEAALISMKIGDNVVASCSGVLVSPKVVVTAGHCVTGFDGWAITLPYAKGQTASTTRSATLYNATGDTVDKNAKDIAVLFLDAPLTLDTYPTLQLKPLDNGTQVLNIGRTPTGGTPSPDSLYVSAPQTLKDGVEIGYPYSYYTNSSLEGGDSGGPVMLAGSNPHVIVGINSGTGDNTEVMARLDVVADWLTAQINAS